MAKSFSICWKSRSWLRFECRLDNSFLASFHPLSLAIRSLFNHDYGAPRWSSLWTVKSSIMSSNLGHSMPSIPLQSPIWIDHSERFHGHGARIREREKRARERRPPAQVKRMIILYGSAFQWLISITYSMCVWVSFSLQSPGFECPMRLSSKCVHVVRR